MIGMFIFLAVCVLLAAKAMLLGKIFWSKDCTGVSGKTQLLYAMIFAARYLDVVAAYYDYPIHISMVRIALTVMTYCTVLSIFLFYRESYQSKYDKFRIELLIFPCVVLSLLANYGFNVVEVAWAFSVFLESVAILPQIHLSTEVKHVENVVYYYISALSIYKIIQLMVMIYHFYVNMVYDKISLAAGIVQLMFYCDFFLKDIPLRGETRGTVNVVDPEVGRNEEDEVKDTRHWKEIEAMRSAAEQERHHENLKEVVLTPASLGAADEQKMNVKPANQEETTETSASTVRV